MVESIPIARWKEKILRIPSFCLFHMHSILVQIYKIQAHELEGKKEIFCLTTHSTHFIYGYVASVIC